MNKKEKILVADDDEFFCKLKQKFLINTGYNVEITNSPDAVIDRISAEQFDLILLDLKFKDTNGIEILKEIKRYDPELHVIIITGFSGFKPAVDAIKFGAYDYLSKDIEDEELLLKIQHALNDRKTRLQLQSLEEAAKVKYNFHNIIGSNKKIQEVFDLINSVCTTDITVLIRGETGTGKELVAKAIHFNSLRKDKTFHAINCAAISETLIESELFGHEKGAFTGAYKQRLGKIELANGGTIFLDEIGDMSINLQAKLLRFLQDKSFERIGGGETFTADVRVLAATNRDLDLMIKEGNFREDLYYRLNLVQINLPPLRERIDDMPLLADYFIDNANKKYNKKIKKIDKDGLSVLAEYTWPGNIRELENFIERLVVLVPEGNITKEYISKHLPLGKEVFSGALDINKPLSDLKDDLEKKYIFALLDKYHANITKIAEKAEMTRAAIYQKIEKYKIRKEDFELK